MDKQFLEFWGNLLLQAAKGQAQMENFNKWLSQSGGNVQNLTDLFKHAYGLKADKATAPDQSPDWQKAFGHFHKAYEDYLALLNVVPLARYRELETQNTALEKEVAQLKKDLEQAGRRSSHSSRGQSEKVISEFEKLLLKQQREFQTLTQQMSDHWRDKSASDD